MAIIFIIHWLAKTCSLILYFTVFKNAAFTKTMLVEVGRQGFSVTRSLCYDRYYQYRESRTTINPSNNSYDHEP